MASPEQEDDRPQHDRIVINLGQQQPAPQQVPPTAKAQDARQQRVPVAPVPLAQGSVRAPRRGVALKILAVLAALLFFFVIAAAVGGYFWWQHYKAGAAYSLALLADAVQHDNMEQFDQVVDTDKVVENMVPQIIDAASAKYGVTASPATRRQIEAAIPRVLPQVKQAIREEVARQAKEISARGEGYPFFLVALAIPYITQINEEGDTAKALVKYQDRNIELTMQRISEERWKIIAIRDDTLTARLVDRIASQLPGAASQIEDAVRQHLGNTPGGLQELLNGIGGDDNGGNATKKKKKVGSRQ